MGVHAGFLEHVLRANLQTDPSDLQPRSRNAVAPPGECGARQSSSCSLLRCCELTHFFSIHTINYKSN